MREKVLLTSFSLLLAVILSTGAVPVCLAAPGNNAVTIVFRYDDYSSRSNIMIEHRILAAFARSHMTCTFGVIPFICKGSAHDIEPQEVAPLSAVKIELLKAGISSGVVEPALHGYSHQSIRTKKVGLKATEYEGLDYNSQLLKLRTGKEFLEKELAVPVNIFIPPWSTSDEKTARALEVLGFECLSSNLTDHTPDSSRLKFLPATCTLDRLREVIEYARKDSASDPIICVVFHDYAFKEIGYSVDEEEQIGLEEFEGLLDWIASQQDVRVAGIGSLMKMPVDLGIQRLVNNKYYVRLAHLKPAFWPPRDGVYLPADKAYEGRIRNVLRDINTARLINIASILSFYLAILALSTLTSFAAGLPVFGRYPSSPRLRIFLRSAVLALSASTLGCLIFFQDLNYRIIASIVACVGGFAGLWLAAKLRPSAGKQFAAARSRFYSEDAFVLPHPIAGRELVMEDKKRGRL